MRSDNRPTETALSEVIDFQEGPGIMARDFRADGVPLIRLAGLSSDSLFAGCNHLDEQMVEHKWNHFRLRAGDTLLSTSASLGRIARVSDEAEGAIPYTGIIRMRPRDGRLDPNFIQYVLEAPDFQGQVEAMGAGSVMRHFGPSHLREMTVTYPPREEQARIAAVLGALDHKIDSNRRLAALLEETAATEFCARFVDLLGVADQRDGLPGGWSLGQLADLVTLTKQTIEPAATPANVFEHFSIAAFDTGRDPEMALGATMLSGKTLLPNGHSVLVSKLNPSTKRIWWARPTGGARAICSPEFLVLAPRDGVPTSYLYAVTSSDSRFYDELLSHVTGTTGSRQRVKPADAMRCRVTLATTESLASWDDFARPIYDRAHATLAESRTLEQIRDALLPKLISGEIRVPDTADPEEVIGPAAEDAAAAV